MDRSSPPGCTSLPLHSTIAHSLHDHHLPAYPIHTAKPCIDLTPLDVSLPNAERLVKVRTHGSAASSTSRASTIITGVSLHNNHSTSSVYICVAPNVLGRRTLTEAPTPIVLPTLARPSRDKALCPPTRDSTPERAHVSVMAGTDFDAPAGRRCAVSYPAEHHRLLQSA